MVINFPNFQKESFLKSFILFFGVIELFLSFIFFNYAEIEKQHLEKNLLEQMKNYSYFFDNDKFDITFMQESNTTLNTLYHNNKEYFIVVDSGDENKDFIKIYYDKNNFENEIWSIYKGLFLHFFLLSIVALSISIIFSFYALYPLQNAYTILQEFMKDVVHDINTPISAIKLNLAMIDNPDEEIKSIQQSINTLEMLHKNIDNYLGEVVVLKQDYNMAEIIENEILFFRLLYSDIVWNVEIQESSIFSDKLLIQRILYNLFNNSAKYNTKQKYVNIKFSNNILTIQNPSYGVKNKQKVFQRFYKEGDRGLGIGLHIVAKILDELQHTYSFEVYKNNIVEVKIYF